ncbi:MAG: nucleoside triphosphate pyrophosphohydrolase [Nitrospinales bacterium]
MNRIDSTKAFARLTDIVETLMGENGCPWDKAQTRESLKPYLVEETYETLEALDQNDPEKIKDELGDLLYQILFHAKIAETKNEFDIGAVVENISDKMERRHPHIFSEGKLETPDQVADQWEDIKLKEKGNQNNPSILSNIPNHLPSLARSQKLQKKAAKHGFDWEKIDDVFTKLDEEIAEFKEAVLECKDTNITDEFGDILFVLVNIARHKKIDAEEALRGTNSKFVKRFQFIEEQAKNSGRKVNEIPLVELENYWQEAKTKK